MIYANMLKKDNCFFVGPIFFLVYFIPFLEESEMDRSLYVAAFQILKEAIQGTGQKSKHKSFTEVYRTIAKPKSSWNAAHIKRKEGTGVRVG